MEQRTLRLGDIVDDYCPRERRITNHAVVAIVEDAIRQTRCTTCDHEHQFKHAREPRRRRKTTSALFDQVLADVSGAQLVVSRDAAPAAGDRPAGASAVVAGAPPTPVAEPDSHETPDASPAAPPDPPASQAPDDADGLWPAHRRLIRATLPKLTDEPPVPRPIPEFTMHQRPQNGRQRNYRLLYGPQGDPFGRAPQQRSQPQQPRGHDANGNGNGAGAPAAGKPRRRRRGGKRR